MAPPGTRPLTGKHLDRDTRAQFSILMQQGQGVHACARILGYSPSILYRELARNRCPDGRSRVAKADRRARSRQRISRRNSRLDPCQIALIRQFLTAHYWSPEQICKALRSRGVEMVCHEAIYRFIRADRLSGGDLWQYLRCSRKKRRKRHGTYDARGRLEGKTMIDERPESVNQRLTFGHWEGDTVVGPGKSCILTLVERKSRLTLIGVLRNRSVEEVNKIAVHLLRPLRHAVKTITFDNGTEFHGYKELERALNIRIYFAHPHHSWERGTNENANGLIRQFIPKRTTMFGLTQTKCVDYMRLLNTRLRKVLGYRTPAEVLYKALGVAI